MLALFVTGVGLVTLATMTMNWSPADFPVESRAWIPQAGLAFDFWLDGPSLFYAWLIYGIGFLVIHYAGFYMKPDDAPWRFYSSILIFLSAMLGLVLARNLLLLFVFWEITSLSSFLLIGHWHRDEEARRGARRALLITGMGGLALMAGIAILGVILYAETGGIDLRIDTVWRERDVITGHALSNVALVLMLIGVFTKSAQFPFHFWLPGAMKAPTPVSALLHAATMVKAGIYLLGRLYPVFNDVLLWPVLVGGAGVMSMLIGGWMALLSHDIKKLLAFSTVSQLGLLTSYYGFGYQRIGGEDLLKLDLLLVASHALFKAGLFMLCGVIDHATHTRDWSKLGGLRRKMPVTTVLTLLGCMTMAGMPFTLGFVAKKLFLEAGMKLEGLPLLVEDGILIAAIVASTFTVAYCLVVALKPFFGVPRDAEAYAHAHEAGPGFLAAPALLIGLCFLGGLYVPLVEKPVSLLVQPDFIVGKSGFVVAWFNKADFLFWLSMAMYFVAAPLLVWWQPRQVGIYRKLGHPTPFITAADGFFDRAVPVLAGWAGEAVKPPSHKRSLALVMLSVVVLVGFPLAKAPLPRIATIEFEPMVLLAVFIGLITIAGALGAILLASLYARLLSLGLAGMMVAALFVVYKAPDLAITQLLIELVILLMFLGFARRARARPSPRKSWDQEVPVIGLSVAVGLVAGLVTCTAGVSEPRDLWPERASVADYYLSNAYYPEEAFGHSGGGNNVVNVTLVDFRALDTFGEVAVLIIAALGVFYLLAIAGGRSRKESPPSPGPWRYLLHRLAPAIALLCAVYALVLFLGGHQVPGGGFIGGLLAAIVLVPAMMAGGRVKVPSPPVLMGLGLLCIVAIGMWPVLGVEPFLKSAFGSVSVPLLGDVKLSTALVFDTGVLLVVFEVTLALVRYFALAPESTGEAPES